MPRNIITFATWIREQSIYIIVREGWYSTMIMFNGSSMDIHRVLTFLRILFPFVSRVQANLWNFICLFGEWLK